MGTLGNVNLIASGARLAGVPPPLPALFSLSFFSPVPSGGNESERSSSHPRFLILAVSRRFYTFFQLSS